MGLLLVDGSGLGCNTSVILLLNDGSGLGYLMSVDYDLLMEYDVSFTVDLSVIYYKLYIRGLYNSKKGLCTIV